MTEIKLIDETVEIDETATIYPNVIIKGNSKIGKKCIITPGTYIENSIIGDNVTIYNSYIIDSTIENDVKIGPYSSLRGHCVIKCQTKVGSFCEVKNTVLNKNSKIPHLSYIGDTTVGENVNIGAGTITANYDGINKNKTIIEDECFIGSNSTLIAPIKIEKGSLVAAGSTLTDDVPSDTLAIARNRQTNKIGYYKKTKM